MNKLKVTAVLGLVALIGYAAGSLGRRTAPAPPAAAPAEESASMAGMDHDMSAMGHDMSAMGHDMSKMGGDTPSSGGDMAGMDHSMHAGMNHSMPTDSAAGKPSNVGAVISIDSAIQSNFGIRVAKVVRGDLQRTINTVGKITQVDTASRRIITAPIQGELVFLSGKADGDTVKRGELLFSMVSEDLFKLESEYQKLVQEKAQDKVMAMMSTLTEQGLSPEQIAQLQDGAAPKMPVKVYAQDEGYVFWRRGAQGDEVSAGMNIYNLGGDKRSVDVTAEIFEQQWGWVHEGQDADMTVRGLPGKKFSGKVTRVEPPVGYTTRSLEVHIAFDTEDKDISQSMFTQVTIKGRARPKIIMAPSEAVIRTGSGDRVVVQRKDGSFQAATVVAGEESGGMTEIISGLSAGDSVVVSGQFLIDSESVRRAGLTRLSSN